MRAKGATVGAQTEEARVVWWRPDPFADVCDIGHRRRDRDDAEEDVARVLALLLPEFDALHAANPMYRTCASVLKLIHKT